MEDVDPDGEGEQETLYPVIGPFWRWIWGGVHVTRTLLELTGVALTLCGGPVGAATCRLGNTQQL